MIGVFDSGYGGLVILKALLDKLPAYSYLYLGDNARAPYGPRTDGEILEFTTQGVRSLLQQGCELVVIGCNTASAIALRQIQREVLPKEFPDRRVLGILVPTVEAITGVGWYETPPASFQAKPMAVAVLATAAAVRSGAYVREISKRNPSIRVVQLACPNLAPLIEQGASEEKLSACVRFYIDQLPELPDAILLGCTHYGHAAHLFRQHLPQTVRVIEQGEAVAARLADYLARHPEIGSRLDHRGRRRFLTTSADPSVSAIASRFFGSPLAFEPVALSQKAVMM